MAKLTLTDVTSGYSTPSTINANYDAIEAALENTLSRDGTSPNTMSASLDMNSQRIINLPDAVSNQEPLTLSQASSLVSISTTFSKENVGGVLWARTTAEVNASVTPTYYYYAPGDVRRYGAVGDGVTDDTTALINAGKSNKRVYIDPSLTCLVTTTLATGLQSNQRWYGGGTITTANGFDFSVFQCSGLTNVVIDGLIGTSGTLGVAYGSANARFFRAISSSVRCGMQNCTITGFQAAAQINASTDCFVHNNEIITPYGWGINVQTGAHRARVTNNYISGVVNEHGIYIAGTSAETDIKHVVLGGNVVNGSTIDGIKMSFCSLTVVDGNAVQDSGGQGVYMWREVTDSVVKGNVISGSGDAGINLWEDTGTSTGNLISGNNVTGSTSNGIVVNSSNTNSVIGNFTNNNVNGIVISSSNNCFVANNTVQSETVGITVSGVNNSVSDNKYNSCTTNLTDTGTNTVHDYKLIGSTTWDPASIAANGKEEKAITVTGAALGDYCIVSFSLDTTGLTLTGDVTSANTVTATLANDTGGAVDLASGTIRAMVFKAQV